MDSRDIWNGYLLGGPLPPTTKALFIESFGKYLLNTYCVPGVYLGTEDTATNKTTIPSLLELTV